VHPTEICKAIVTRIEPAEDEQLLYVTDIDPGAVQLLQPQPKRVDIDEIDKIEMKPGDFRAEKIHPAIVLYNQRWVVLSSLVGQQLLYYETLENVKISFGRFLPLGQLVAKLEDSSLSDSQTVIMRYGLTAPMSLPLEYRQLSSTLFSSSITSQLEFLMLPRNSISLEYLKQLWPTWGKLITDIIEFNKAMPSPANTLKMWEAIKAYCTAYDSIDEIKGEYGGFVPGKLEQIHGISNKAVCAWIQQKGTCQMASLSAALWAALTKVLKLYIIINDGHRSIQVALPVHDQPSRYRYQSFGVGGPRIKYHLQLPSLLMPSLDSKTQDAQEVKKEKTVIEPRLHRAHAARDAREFVAWLLTLKKSVLVPPSSKASDGLAVALFNYLGEEKIEPHYINQPQQIDGLLITLKVMPDGKCERLPGPLPEQCTQKKTQVLVIDLHAWSGSGFLNGLLDAEPLLIDYPLPPDHDCRIVCLVPQKAWRDNIYGSDIRSRVDVVPWPTHLTTEFEKLSEQCSVSRYSRMVPANTKLSEKELPFSGAPGESLEDQLGGRIRPTVNGIRFENGPQMRAIQEKCDLVWQGGSVQKSDHLFRKKLLLERRYTENAETVSCPPTILYIQEQTHQWPTCLSILTDATARRQAREAGEALLLTAPLFDNFFESVHVDSEHQAIQQGGLLSFCQEHGKKITLIEINSNITTDQFNYFCRRLREMDWKTPLNIGFASTAHATQLTKHFTTTAFSPGKRKKQGADESKRSKCVRTEEKKSTTSSPSSDSGERPKVSVFVVPDPQLFDSVTQLKDQKLIPGSAEEVILRPTSDSSELFTLKREDGSTYIFQEQDLLKNELRTKKPVVFIGNPSEELRALIDSLSGFGYLYVNGELLTDLGYTFLITSQSSLEASRSHEWVQVFEPKPLDVKMASASPFTGLSTESPSSLTEMSREDQLYDRQKKIQLRKAVEELKEQRIIFLEERLNAVSSLQAALSSSTALTLFQGQAALSRWFAATGHGIQLLYLKPEMAAFTTQAIYFLYRGLTSKKNTIYYRGKRTISDRHWAVVECSGQIPGRYSPVLWSPSSLSPTFLRREGVYSLLERTGTGMSPATMIQVGLIAFKGYQWLSQKLPSQWLKPEHLLAATARLSLYLQDSRYEEYSAEVLAVHIYGQVFSSWIAADSLEEQQASQKALLEELCATANLDMASLPQIPPFTRERSQKKLKQIFEEKGYLSNPRFTAIVQALDEFEELHKKPGSKKIFLLESSPGVGKTSLLTRWFRAQSSTSRYMRLTASQDPELVDSFKDRLLEALKEGVRVFLIEELNVLRESEQIWLLNLTVRYPDLFIIATQNHASIPGRHPLHPRLLATIEYYRIMDYTTLELRGFAEQVYPASTAACVVAAFQALTDFQADVLNAPPAEISNTRDFFRLLEKMKTFKIETVIEHCAGWFNRDTFLQCAEYLEGQESVKQALAAAQASQPTPRV
jgi:hypothetical protein